MKNNQDPNHTQKSEKKAEELEERNISALFSFCVYFFLAFVIFLAGIIHLVKMCLD